jgi:hypothetical protein
VAFEQSRLIPGNLGISTEVVGKTRSREKGVAKLSKRQLAARKAAQTRSARRRKVDANRGAEPRRANNAVGRKKNAPAAKRSPRSLIVKRLEGVSKDVFKRHYPLITELIGNSPGIYALYEEGDLYYVGKSTDLRRRVKHHLRDRHLASWTHFSLYLARREEHIHEIESLLVRIANPKGNKIVPRGRSSGPLVKALKRLIKAKQKEELADLFAEFKKHEPRRISKAVGRAKSLVGLVSKRTPIYREYKGREYTGTLSPKGVITLNGKQYTSPSGAAKAILKSGAANGWSFWYIKDDAGDWVKLRDYRG